MSEIFGQEKWRSENREWQMQCDVLLRKHRSVDSMTPEEREILRTYGDFCLKKPNAFEAMKIFRLLQDFEGIRKTIQSYPDNSDSYDLVKMLVMVEDHEAVRDLLNKKKDPRYFEYTRAFSELEAPLVEYRDAYLEKNGTPVATGGLETGIDLVTIRNLAKMYEVAVPIARGGLSQGAVADLWGMPTRIADISAHGRKVARGKWVHPVAREDFEGKRVLLFDKDAVSGATIRKAVKMLEPYHVASIGVYFARDVVEEGGYTHTQGLPEGITIHYPKNSSFEGAGDAYIEAHERLQTVYGRRRLLEKQFLEGAEELKKDYPRLTKSLRAYTKKHFRVFDSLNPFLAGISNVRSHIIAGSQTMLKDTVGFVQSDLGDLPGTEDRLVRILDHYEPLAVGFEADLVRARYHKQAGELAQKRQIENTHEPSDPLGAFAAAAKAKKQGFEVALIVGPEGFAYEPFFLELGMQTVAVNIPESGPDEPRTISLLDQLDALEGKKVVVVEDDIRTGATLHKLLEHVKPHLPGRLGLYLGQPKQFQLMENIPADFNETFVAGEIDVKVAAKAFTKFLETKGLKVFKPKL